MNSKPINRDRVKCLAALAIVGLALAGCAKKRAATADEIVAESLKRSEEAYREHVIGFDSKGLPVYAVDEEGRPVTNRKKRDQYQVPDDY
jgi:hypothetical protein